jgi:hypothetical protein
MRKFKFLSIVIILFAGMFAFFQSCQKDFEVEPIEKAEIDNNQNSLKYLTFEEISNDATFNKLLDNFNFSQKTKNSKLSNSFSLPYTTLASDNEVLDTSIIKVIESENTTSFSLKTVGNETIDNSFTNVVLIDGNDSQFMFTLHYEPDDNWINNPSGGFTGTVTIESVCGIYTTETLVGTTDCNQDGGSEPPGTGYELVCFQISLYVDYPCSCEPHHDVGDDCGCYNPPYTDLDTWVDCIWIPTGSNIANYTNLFIGGGSSGNSSSTEAPENFLGSVPTSPVTVYSPAELIINNAQIYAQYRFSDETIEWLFDNVQSQEVSEFNTFLAQNQYSYEACQFVNLAVQAQNELQITEILNLIQDDFSSSDAIQAGILTFAALNNNMLNGPYDSNYLNTLSIYTEMDVLDPVWMMYFSLSCASIRLEHPDWSDIHVYWEASKEMIHIALDLGGMVPVIGEVCDLINGVIYTIEGDGLNASLSFAATIPIAGWFSTGAKYVIKAGGLKLIVKANNIIDFGARNSKRFRQALGLVVGDGKHAHHIIPWEFREISNLVQNAAKDPRAFHMDDALINGFPLPSTNHLTGHPAYSSKVFEKLEELDQLSNTPQEAYDNLISFIDELKSLLQNNPDLNLGQIAELIP